MARRRQTPSSPSEQTPGRSSGQTPELPAVQLEGNGPTPRDGVTLRNEKKPTLVTEARIRDLADRIINSGYTKWDVVEYAQNTYGVGKGQALKYYYASLRYLTPDDPAQYRESLIERNFQLLETILNRALAEGNLKEANNAVKLMNDMLGAGGNKRFEVETPDKTRIAITFTD